jgi:hypothetical protein
MATTEDEDDGGGGDMGVSDSSLIDYGRKVLHCSWHPHEDIVAVAGLNDLFIYSKQNNSPVIGLAVIVTSSIHQHF